MICFTWGAIRGAGTETFFQMLPINYLDTQGWPNILLQGMRSYGIAKENLRPEGVNES